MTAKKQKPKRPRGRPRGSTIAEPKIQRQIRVSDADWRRIKVLAAEQGESISAYLRRRGLEVQ